MSVLRFPIRISVGVSVNTINIKYKIKDPEQNKIKTGKGLKQE